jgi:TolB protein
MKFLILKNVLFLLFVFIMFSGCNVTDVEEEGEKRYCPHSSWDDPYPKNCYVFYDVYPSWSPDGEYIAYIGSNMKDDGFSVAALFIYDLSHGTTTHLIDHIDNKSSQAWSPDGEWITFSRGAQIYKIRKDGSELTRLTKNDERAYFDAAWSPDGIWIAYQDRTPISPYESKYPDSVLKRGTWVMNSDGTNKQWHLRYVHDSTWNPFIKTHILSVISLSAFVNDFRFLIWSPFYSQKDTLTIRDSAINMNPHYSPDGAQIVFCSSLEDIDIWVINTDGTGLRRLTKNGGAHPAWSPDGKTIAYINIDYFEGGGEIWLMNKDGTNRRPMRR